MGSESERVMVDPKASVGDLLLINAQTPHGVETIGEDSGEDWMSFEGRWSTLFAMNKVVGGREIDDSVEV